MLRRPKLRFKGRIKCHLSTNGNVEVSWEDEAKNRPIWKCHITIAHNATELLGDNDDDDLFMYVCMYDYVSLYVL